VKLLPPRGERLAPLLSGLLLVLSFPPFRLLVPPFVALVPLLLFIAERAPGRQGRWEAIRAGYFAGLVYFGLLLYWMLVALVYYTALAIPAYVLTVLILAGFVASFAGALHYVLERTPVPLALAAGLLWTAFEWLQGHLSDLSFPWLGLGTSLAAFPRLAGAADLVGARGLSFWLATTNGLIAMVVLQARAGRSLSRLVALTAAVLLLPIGYGFWRAETLVLRPAARVAVVQPNIPEDLKLDRTQAIDSSLAAVRALAARVPPGTVDLVVWPEVTIPALLVEEPHLAALRADVRAASQALEEEIRSLARLMGAPIVAGAYGLEIEPDGKPVYFNSAFLVGPTGRLGPRYDKQYLVPFVERVPFIDPAWLERLIGDIEYFGGLGRGRDAPALGPEEGRFGILICYESIFAPLARRYRAEGVDYLVNITNDAWYGREPWYARTTALWQHPAHLTMRAIEQRVGIARAANTGISMFVDPIGRTYQRTRLFERDVRIDTVYTTDTVTLYARWGDWLASGATVGALLLVLTARFAGGRLARAEGAGRRG
jgi:apolipoprotein N-acyltransferase